MPVAALAEFVGLMARAARSTPGAAAALDPLRVEGLQDELAGRNNLKDAPPATLVAAIQAFSALVAAAARRTAAATSKPAEGGGAAGPHMKQASGLLGSLGVCTLFYSSPAVLWEVCNGLWVWLRFLSLAGMPDCRPELIAATHPCDVYACLYVGPRPRCAPAPDRAASHRLVL